MADEQRTETLKQWMRNDTYLLPEYDDDCSKPLYDEVNRYFTETMRNHPHHEDAVVVMQRRMLAIDIMRRIERKGTDKELWKTAYRIAEQMLRDNFDDPTNTGVRGIDDWEDVDDEWHRDTRTRWAQVAKQRLQIACTEVQKDRNVGKHVHENAIALVQSLGIEPLEQYDALETLKAKLKEEFCSCQDIIENDPRPVIADLIEKLDEYLYYNLKGKLKECLKEHPDKDEFQVFMINTSRD